jgi:hypothetical protein
MMQLVFAIILSFAYYSLQISCQPYMNPYNNNFAASVNMLVVATLFASLLMKVDREMEGSLSYEPGYDLKNLGVVLIVWTGVVSLEIMRYFKMALEFATSVVVVTSTLFDVKHTQEKVRPGLFEKVWAGSTDRDHGCREARKDLENYVDSLHHYAISLEDDRITDKVPVASKHDLREKIEEVRIWLKNTHGCFDADECRMKREELSKIAQPITARTSVAGLYFPVDKNKLQPFPQMGLFRQISLVFSKGADGGCNFSFWWRKEVYINDTSGWILRRTTQGWEILPDLSGKPAEFLAEGDSVSPPNSGWVTRSNQETTELATRQPFRWGQCCAQLMLPGHTPAKIKNDALAIGLLSEERESLYFDAEEHSACLPDDIGSGGTSSADGLARWN